MFNKRVTKWIAMTVITGLLIVGCNGDSQPTQTGTIESSGGPLGKYQEPVTVTVAMVAPPFVKYAQGESVDNNIWTRGYEEQLGIKVKFLWTAAGWGEPYDQKVNTSLAADDLPDVLSLYTTLFMRAKDAGKLQDIKPAYEQYASDRLKSIMNAMDGAALKGSMFDGKMYGVGSPAALPLRPIAWIRADWMEQLNLEEPENISQVLEIAKAFREAEVGGSDTVGLAFSKDLVTMNHFFAAYNSYPEKWDVSDGKFAYGATIPSVKEPLNVLAELYKEKVIDNEFAIKATDVELKNDIIAGRVGIVLGNVNDVATAINDAHKNDGADWIPVPIDGIDGQPAKAFYDPAINSFAVVSSKCEYPEAAVKMINFALETLEGKPEWVTDNSFHTTKDGYMAFFYPPLRMSDPAFNMDTYDMVQEAMATNDTSKMNVQQKAYYDRLENYMSGSAPDEWVTFKQWGPQGVLGLQRDYMDGNMYTRGRAIMTETPSWVQNGQNITSKLQEFFIKAIMNDAVDAEYESFIQYFNQQGGKEATDEINQLNAQYLN